jgi:hypothetical protein
MNEFAFSLRQIFMKREPSFPCLRGPYPLGIAPIDNRVLGLVLKKS